MMKNIIMAKIVIAVPPYIYKGVSNFKYYPYKAWAELGGNVAKSHYMLECFHGLIYKFQLPSWFKFGGEARLRFVSGYSIQFDTFPDYAFHEIIPVIWDCWPKQVDAVVKFFKKYDVRTAIFTSSQTADVFRKTFPQMNILAITEGINTELYFKGDILLNRTVDVLEIGRKNGNFFKGDLPCGIHHLRTGNFERTFKTDEEFRMALADTKVTITVPRCDVDKDTAGNIETLTQRYWECMLSRIVMVGRAPQELIDLIGYNPVIDWDGNDASPLVSQVLQDISSYQGLVDKNYETAKRMASWDIRMKVIMEYLEKLGYSVR